MPRGVAIQIERVESKETPPTSSAHAVAGIQMSLITSIAAALTHCHDPSSIILLLLLLVSFFSF